MPIRRTVLLALLALWVLGAVALVWLPIGAQLSAILNWISDSGPERGATGYLSAEAYDFLLNLGLLAVPAALASAIWPHVRWWVWVGAAAAMSGLIELVQGLAQHRTASLLDVVSNTAGVLLGLGLLAIWRRVRGRRDERPAF